jgi:curli production assembly/transport component CsgG
MKKIILTSIIALLLSGCVSNRTLDKFAEAVKSADVPNTVPEPEAKAITKLSRSPLADLAAPSGPPIAIAVYNFTDKTGQRKPNDTVAVLSSAVTQGAEVFLIKALQDAGKGKWFQVVERVGLDNLVKERQLIRSQRETYEGKEAKPLSPMLVAGVMIEGGIVGYDTNVGTGGVGAALLGISGTAQYRTDVVTVVMRLISVSTGEVLISSGATKTILSSGISGNVMKFIDHSTMSVQMEAGYNMNEQSTYAVRLATEEAVADMIRQGATKKLWAFAAPKTNKPKGATQ